MIVFWALAALLTVAVVFMLARPLMRPPAEAEAGGSDLVVYRDQLAELERDRARGLVDPAEAASLEAEIGRRMLSASRQAGERGTSTASAGQAWRLTALLAAIVPLGALVIYLAVGQPGLPAQPLADRQIAPDSDPVKMLAAVDDVRSKLKPVPDDMDRWVMVAQAYAKLGRARDSAEAFRVASNLAPEDMALKAALAESLVLADGGAIGDEAKKLFQSIPSDSPSGPEARFYLALAASQAGDIKAALKGWQSLLADSPADAGWIEPTRARIAEAAQSLGLDPAKETPSPRPASAPAPLPAAGPPPDADAIAKMSPEQQQQMIQSMVASLAAKLEANPDNAAGWRQLGRAYTVLGEDDKAKAAFDRAAQAEAKAGAKP